MSSYALTSLDYVVTHGSNVTLLLGDHEQLDDPHHITPADVAARSGDYLATLATRLDMISQHLVAANEPEHSELQKIVDELLSIDTKYELKRK